MKLQWKAVYQVHLEPRTEHEADALEASVLLLLRHEAGQPIDASQDGRGRPLPWHAVRGLHVRLVVTVVTVGLDADAVLCSHKETIRTKPLRPG